jgi:cell division protease FtsH
VILGANRHLVEALRDALLERHELIGDEIIAVIEAASAAVEPATLDLRDVVLEAQPR